MYHFLPGGESRRAVKLADAVSKYIGETEQHLAALSERDRSRGRVLLFDEANAPFDKTHEVKDASGHQANLEVNGLLQWIEDCDGLEILATKFHADMDGALVRRFNVVSNFPKPEERMRLVVWRVA